MTKAITVIKKNEHKSNQLERGELKRAEGFHWVSRPMSFEKMGNGPPLSIDELMSLGSLLNYISLRLAPKFA